LVNFKFSSPTLTFLFGRNIKHSCLDSSEFEHHWCSPTKQFSNYEDKINVFFYFLKSEKIGLKNVTFQMENHAKSRNVIFCLCVANGNRLFDKNDKKHLFELMQQVFFYQCNKWFSTFSKDMRHPCSNLFRKRCVFWDFFSSVK
jgi:hypothetical protein